eukprot:TRINITY_DN61631_c1_g1_i1.p2 TRINITY_DN61631_c1_g1~~TRINITY_DN61631_c1_g1_i1.p2  ORF type:complete len:354 (-),score=62.50 TRINITY_DN61631_c1_g1_i1:1888-2949(-)
MNDADRTSIHEAMEQQTISISKAGIVTSLKARCAVVAAANPIGGKYKPGATFEENVDMTTPILQRFDLLYVIVDEGHDTDDRRLAEFVCKAHRLNHPIVAEQLQTLMKEQQGMPIPPIEMAEKDILLQERKQQLDDCKAIAQERLKDILQPVQDVSQIPQDLLKKYIQYAKSTCRPSLSSIDKNQIVQLYKDLRRESQLGCGVVMSVRHLESILRLAEAHARMFLRQTVQEVDTNAAIRLFLKCFIKTQKHQQKTRLERNFQKYLGKEKGASVVLLHILKNKWKLYTATFMQKKGLYNPAEVKLPISDVIDEAEQYGLHKKDVMALFRTKDFKQDFEHDQDYIFSTHTQTETA